MTDDTLDDTNRAKVTRAFQRRFRVSTMPLTFTVFRHVNGAKCVRVRDTETGTWAEYNISWKRIGRMREHDAMDARSSTILSGHEPTV
jgi:hypothetical protein